jgi:hypothetical protein
MRVETLSRLRKVPHLRYQQNKQAGAQKHDQEQSDPAQPLMTGQASIDGLDAAIVLIFFGRERRHDNITT